MDRDDFKERLEGAEYPSQKLRQARFFFNEDGIKFIHERADNEAICFLVSDDNREYRTLFYLDQFNVREVDVGSRLLEFYDEAVELVELYRENKVKVTSKFTVHDADNTELTVDGHDIDLQKGQSVLLVEG